MTGARRASRAGAGSASSSSCRGPRWPPATGVPADRGRIAVLDTGARAPGYDAFDRDRDPAAGADPRAPSRRETSGDALAEIVTAAGERTLTIRVAGYGATPEVHGTTD